MEKNRIRPIKSGKSSRMSYARQKEVVQMPNLIEVQTTKNLHMFHLILIRPQRWRKPFRAKKLMRLLPVL